MKIEKEIFTHSNEPNCNDISSSNSTHSQETIYSIIVLVHFLKGFFLQEFGHYVRLATHANFRTFVKSAGIDFYPLGGDPRIMAQCMVLVLLYHKKMCCLCR
jgi:hypothetical protein